MGEARQAVLRFSLTHRFPSASYSPSFLTTEGKHPRGSRGLRRCDHYLLKSCIPAIKVDSTLTGRNPLFLLKFRPPAESFHQRNTFIHLLLEFGDHRPGDDDLEGGILAVGVARGVVFVCLFKAGERLRYTSLRDALSRPSESRIPGFNSQCLPLTALGSNAIIKNDEY